MVEDDRYDALMSKKGKAQLTKFGDVAGALNPWLHEEGKTRRRVQGARLKGKNRRTR
jgi:hypothetical protein